MRLTATLCALGILGCSGAWEPSEAERSTAEERQAYRKKVDSQFQLEALTQQRRVTAEPVVWARDGRKLREAPPNRLVPTTPKLPDRKSIARIEFGNGLEAYWVAETAAEIDRIYDCVLRESLVLQEPETVRYFFPDGSSFEAPISRDVFSHACAMGLTFYSGEELIYEVSCHPSSLDLELRHSREGHIRNPALNAIIQDYCRRSPRYVQQHPDE